MKIIRAIVIGAAGRMGGRILSAIHETADIRLGGAVERNDHPALGRDAGETAGMGRWNVPLVGSLKEVVASGDVVIDFTNAEASLKNLKISAEEGKAAVIGSTGFSPQQVEEARELARRVPCVLSPNMSVGVNVMFKIVADLAAVLGDDYDIELIEAHHRMKKDAPSGTAMKLGQVLAEAVNRNFGEVGVFARKGLIGERTRKEIGMQTIRAGDIIGEHTVLFGGLGERLEVTHRAHNRDNFARGAVRAARWVVDRKPGLYDMQNVLGIK
jgi:4-hydroxy-tetrahydrodipicolinate reductase